MNDGTHVTTWVGKDIKARFGTLASYQGLTESALLKRMIELALKSSDGLDMTTPLLDRSPGPRASRLTIRLAPEDQSLLHERAAARGLPSATYVSVLTRSHLRSVAPLPKEELLALKRTIGELGAIGRNLNQIARAAHQDGRVSAPGREHVAIMLKVCGALRDHVRALLAANTRSWEQGRAEPGA